MKKNIIAIGILMLVISATLSCCVGASYNDDGWDYYEYHESYEYPDLTGLWIVLIIILIGMVVIEITARKNRQEKYKIAIESLDKQLKDKDISEKNYIELRNKLEEEHKHKWWQ